KLQTIGQAQAPVGRVVGGGDRVGQLPPARKVGAGALLRGDLAGVLVIALLAEPLEARLLAGRGLLGPAVLLLLLPLPGGALRLPAVGSGLLLDDPFLASFESGAVPFGFFRSLRLG